jgi:hypothetical protein
MTIALAATVLVAATTGLVIAQSTDTTQKPRTETRQRATMKAHTWNSAAGDWVPFPDVFPKGGEISLFVGIQAPARPTFT